MADAQDDLLAQVREARQAFFAGRGWIAYEVRSALTQWDAAVARALEATIRNAGRFTQDELQELRDLFLAKLKEAPDA